jgi:hypothetical protein
VKNAYNKLAHVLRNNVPIIRHMMSDIEQRLLEIEEAFDGRPSDNDTIDSDATRPGDAPEV